jgi:hypothetical protein
MLTAAIVATLLSLGFRAGLWSIDQQGKFLASRGIDPDEVGDRRVGQLGCRAGMWLFGVVAALLWVLAVLSIWD